MTFILILAACVMQPGAATSSTPSELELPKPHFRQQPGDPPWLVQAVQFHGHLGPSVIAGARFGMAGLRAVGAHGFFDVEVTCEGPFAKPPQSCFLDGVQVATGATLGKRSINWVPTDQILVRVKNTRTGKTAELRPTSRLLELAAVLTSKFKAVAERDAKNHSAEDPMEAVARQIASMPEKELVIIKTVGTAAK